MLRRILTCTFALLLFALAFSIGPPRAAAPSDVTAVEHDSPGLRIVAVLFLPQTAVAQALGVISRADGL